MDSFFRRCLARELEETFFNLREYAEEHEIAWRLSSRDTYKRNKTIKPKKYICQLQNLTIDDIGFKRDIDKDGVLFNDLNLYIEKHYLDEKPETGELLWLDGNFYQVALVQEQMGLYIIELSRYDS